MFYCDDPEYQIIPDYLFRPDLGWYHSYGIQAFTNHEGIRKAVHTIHDVSVLKSHVESTVELLNAERVSLVHFRDVVEDSLYGI